MNEKKLYLSSVLEYIRRFPQLRDKSFNYDNRLLNSNNNSTEAFEIKKELIRTLFTPTFKNEFSDENLNSYLINGFSPKKKVAGILTSSNDSSQTSKNRFYSMLNEACMKRHNKNYEFMKLMVKFKTNNTDIDKIIGEYIEKLRLNEGELSNIDLGLIRNEVIGGLKEKGFMDDTDENWGSYINIIKSKIDELNLELKKLDLV